MERMHSAQYSKKQFTYCVTNCLKIEGLETKACLFVCLFVSMGHLWSAHLDRTGLGLTRCYRLRPSLVFLSSSLDQRASWAHSSSLNHRRARKQVNPTVSLSLPWVCFHATGSRKWHGQTSSLGARMAPSSAGGICKFTRQRVWRGGCRDRPTSTL